MKLLRMIGRVFNRPYMERRFRASTTNRLIDWALSPVKINAELKTDYLSMTLRARDLAKNNEFVAGYLDNLKRNVLGAHGFTLQSKAEPSELARKVEALWQEYQSRNGAFVTLDELQSGRIFTAFPCRRFPPRSGLTSGRRGTIMRMTSPPLSRPTPIFFCFFL